MVAASLAPGKPEEWGVRSSRVPGWLWREGARACPLTQEDRDKELRDKEQNDRVEVRCKQISVADGNESRGYVL